MINNNSLAIIPARGGSKRIPRKNIRPFCGKPIIGYSIEAALKSGLYSEVMVSTDDDEIAEIARSFGAEVPFMRSDEASNDFAGTAEVLAEVLQQYINKGRRFDFATCIYPTSPFVTVNALSESFELLEKNKYDVVFPVIRYSYPIQRSLRFVHNKIEMLWPENYPKRSQDLEPVFHDAGQFYSFSVEYMLAKQRLFSNNSGAIIISELEAQDIDNLEDWKLAEVKFKMLF